MTRDVLLVEPWAIGGTAKYVEHLAAALARRAPADRRVVVLAPHNFPYDPKGCAVLRMLPSSSCPSESQLVNGLRLAQRSVIAQRIIIREIKRRRPAVVHFSGASLVTGRVVACARRLGIPLVAAMHDLPLPGLSAANLLWLQWRPHFLRADAVIVHGPWGANELRRLYPGCGGPLEVIRYGPFSFGKPTSSDRQRLRVAAGLPVDKTILLFFGSLRRDKGLSLLLRALSLDIQRRFHLYVVGNRPAVSEPAAEAYQRESEGLDIAASVTWRIGYAPDDDVPDIFEMADIVVLPYGPHYTAYSAVLAMAVSYERPVVASDVGDTGRAITEFRLGLTAGDGSPERVFDALCLVADSPDRFREDLQAFRSEFSWDAMADSTWRLYAQFFSRGG